MNKKLIFIVFFIIGVAIAGYFTYNRKAEAPLAQTYSSDAVAFQYPATYTVLETETSTSTTSMLVKAMVLLLTEDYNAIADGTRVDGDGPQAMTFQVLRNPESLSPNAWAEKNPEVSNAVLKTSEVKETTLAGVPAITYTADGLYQNQYVIAAKGDKIYFLNTAYLDTDSPLYKDLPEILKTFILP